ncbi:hypothetical protein GCM10009718_23630 [Isoptericola halotolerans]|uniref:Protein-glutamine gamma-glutamyltransferase-like C-terminal domain-containing protein n=1 Tax=Isoptericola halotolerans TaxID=300560 RepID=A0ABX2A5L0_9MICO|nr:DUF4129 domain-containing protein [Isoptericola halotolerans]NOV98074.1 hypothetical protein [Isoptericola halotolerans]
MRPRDLGTHPATLVVLTATVLLGAATATPWRLTLPAPLLEIALGEAPEPVVPPPPPPGPPDDPTARDPDDTLLTVLAVLGVVALVLLLWVAARKVLAALRSTTPAPAPPEPDTLDPGTDLATDAEPTMPLPELVDAVTRALALLDAADGPRDAVVAAWVALEDAAAEHGTARDPAQTPTEFTAQVLAATAAPPDHVTALRHLYQRARFTTRPTAPEDVASARDALVHIARSLDTPDAP